MTIATQGRVGVPRGATLPGTGRPTLGNLTDNPMQKFGFALLIAFLFIVFGRVPELLRLPYIALISALLSLVAAVFIGGIPLALASRAGILLSVFTLWMCVAFPFSVWKSGSLGLMKETWSRSFMTFIIVAASIHGVSQCRKAVNAFTWATGFIVIASRFRGTVESGRLGMDTGTLKNPNDFAAYLLLGLPFCLYAIIARGESKLYRLASVLIVSMVAVLVLKTGSRAGLLTFLAVLVFLFFKLSPGGKFAMAVPAALLVLALPWIVPRSVIDRYETLVSGEDGEAGPAGGDSASERQGEFASTSMNARSNLLKKSIVLTFQNPIVGVGPGMFRVAVSDYAREQGERAPWQQTHNTYTQISSELGLPALIIYLILLGHCIRAMAAVQKLAKNSRDAELQKLGNMAFCVQVAWISYCTVAMFGSYAYHLHVPILAGMTEAIRRASLPFVPAATSAPPSRMASRPFAATDRNR